MTPDDRVLDILKGWLDERNENIMRRFDQIDKRFDDLPCKAHAEVVRKASLFFAHRRRMGAAAWSIVLLVVSNALAWCRVFLGSGGGGK